MPRPRILATLLLALMPFQLPAAIGAETPVRLATTTSTENSGLLGYLLPAFERATGYRVHVIAVGTGKALRMGRDGDVDVVLVHDANAEREFVKSGFGVARREVMYNDFVLVGPRDDPAGIRGSGGAETALARIAASSSRFVSRGDESGTHRKERSLWQRAGIEPAGAWYLEAGQGMGKVLQMAAELSAYTLTDRGTWLAYRERSTLRILHQGDPSLYNPYGIIAVSPSRYPDIHHAGANALIEWITSPQGQRLIGGYTVSDAVLFTPSAGPARYARERSAVRDVP